MKYFDGQQFTIWNDHPVCHGFAHNNALYYGIQYNHTGPLTFAIDSDPAISVNGAYVFITTPGHRYLYGCEETESRHHSFICSTGERLQQYVEGGLFPADCRAPIPVADPERFLQTMLEIMSLLNQSPVPPARAILLYEDLLLRIAESGQEKQTFPLYCGEKIRHLAEQIRLAPEAEYDFSRAAKECAVTLIHFRRLFKQLLGLPPQQFLIHCRLQKAAALLLAPGEPLTMGEIAERSGIPDQNYFSRLFKRQFHVSPLTYRREFQSPSM